MKLEKAKQFVGTKAMLLNKKETLSKIEEVKEIQNNFIIAYLENKIVANILLLRNKNGENLIGD